jgi:hypothetical protein
MTIRECTLEVMKKRCVEWTRQTDIIKEVSKLTGYSYESCRGNSFRNVNAIPEIHLNYKKEIIDGYTSYINGSYSYKQEFNKPKEYYNLLSFLNESEKIYTLSGTESNCCKILDNSKTIKIDHSPHTDGLSKNIYTIKDKASYNLDFEGILTLKKIDYINNLPFEKLILTFRRSKRDSLLKNINADIISYFEYRSNRGVKMVSYLFSKCHNLTGDSLNK